MRTPHRAPSLCLRLLARLAPVAALLVCAALPRSAAAYPQWQFSSGTSRCNQCHFAPAGTGLITNYARDASGDELSTFKGDGGFLHGATELPDWLALGVDLRGAIVRYYAGDPQGAATAIFPMQADLYARAAFLENFSIALTGGYRGQARSDFGPIGDDNALPTSESRLISREHYLMWRLGALGPYVRVGRFFAPYGLRLVEHTAYIMRDVGDNLLQEGYGVSAGMVENEWELHVTAFGPDFLRQFGTKEKGAAALYEHRFADAYALAIQGRLGITDDAKRYGGGFYAKAYLAPGKTLFMAEADIFHWQGKTGSGANQLVGYFGPTMFPVKGLWLSIYGEVNQTDIRTKGTATTALDGQINWFPYPHFEFVVLGRLQTPDSQDSAKTLMLQIHYYL
jgi:hypothetical protein